MVTSYNGWQASQDPRAIGINRDWEPIPGHKFPGGIKSGDVEIVMTYLVRQLDARVEPIEHYPPGDEWGWFYKPSANSPNLISNHSSGTAVDYNATRHPNGKRGTWTPWQVAEIRKILLELGGVVRWLGDATGTPDEMHFEIRGTPAQVAAVAERLQEGDEMTDEDILKIADAVGQVMGAKLDAAVDELKKKGADLRDSEVTAFRRCLGVPLMADSSEQHKADEDTGRRMQALLGD